MKKIVFFLLFICPMIQLKAQINGNYLIGQGGYSETLTEILDKIQSDGINGKTTISILPGNYQENILLENVNGLSEKHTLTIKAKEGLGTVIIETFDGNPTNALVILKRCPYVTFKDIEFKKHGQSINFFDGYSCDNLLLRNCKFGIISYYDKAKGRVIVKSSDNVKIENCYISQRLFLENIEKIYLDSTTINSEGLFRTGISIKTDNSDTIIISNCKIFKYGIKGGVDYLHISNTVIPDIYISPCSHFIMNNSVMSREGVTVRNRANLTARISGNIFLGGEEYGDDKIRLDSCKDCLIEANIINDIETYGIWMKGSGTINNNMIGGTWYNYSLTDRYGIYASGDIDIYFNTISIRLVTALNEAVGVFVEGGGGDIRNNIIAVDHPIGYALKCHNLNSSFSSENNIMYNLEGPLVWLDSNVYCTINQWSDSTGNDIFSSDVTPNFWSVKDLHLQDTAGILKVHVDTCIPFDIDGEQRPNFTFVGADQFSCNNFHVLEDYYKLTANIEGVEYQWIDCNKNNIPIKGETNQIFDLEYNGDYAVIIKSELCDYTSPCYSVEHLAEPDTTVTDTTSVMYGHNPENMLKIFPNPVSDILFLNFNEFDIRQITIIDITGTIVKSITPGSNEIAVSDLSKGIYCLVIMTEEGTKKRTFIKN